MSYYEDFSKKSNKNFCRRWCGNNLFSLHNVAILAKIPLKINISKFCDQGKI